MNDFSKKCEILGDLWINYNGDEAFTDFIEYNDIGLPLAYCVSAGLATVQPQGELYINETWDLLIEALNAPDNIEYESLNDLLDRAEGYSEE